MKKVLLAVIAVAAFALTGCNNKEHCWKVTMKCDIDGDKHEYVAYGWGTKEEVAEAQEEAKDNEDCTFKFKKVSGGVLTCAAKAVDEYSDWAE